MGYTDDNNTLNSLIEGRAIADAYGVNMGLDYTHINSMSVDDNRKAPVVYRMKGATGENMRPSDPRGLGRADVVQQKNGNLEFSKRAAGIFGRYENLMFPKIDTFTMIEDDKDDPDIIYSAAPLFTGGHGNSAAFSQPSRPQRILEGPDRAGNRLPSVLENRSSRMRNIDSN